MASRIIPVERFDLVLFGVTGDLSRRKILPALYHRMSVGQIPAGSRIVGVARGALDREGLLDLVRRSLDSAVPEARRDADKVEAFCAALDYVAVDVADSAGWDALKAVLEDTPNRVRAFYLSVGPSLFGPIADALTEHGIADADSRIVIEKPFGHDLASARRLNEQLAHSFAEDQIYRIDHYLGKETVQNLMAVRFANALFEPLWNARHIDHVQITVAETIGIEGRGAYYDRTGATRDMVQNHLMQLLCLIAMEPPAHFDANAVRDEKVKVIRALEPIRVEDTVRGQYRGNGTLASYKEDAENPDSHTESSVALKAAVSNWRWSGVPFYLRTGKRMRGRVSEIVIQFREPPHNIFRGTGRAEGNMLVIRLQPDEGITLSMTIKEPGPGGMRFTRVPLDMSFATALGDDGDSLADAYERLIMDVIRGDQTLFMRGDEVEEAWKWIDPIVAAWAEDGSVPHAYDSGGSGPIESLALIHRDGRNWREIE